MSSNTGGSFTEKHHHNARPDPNIAKEVQKRIKDGSLPCAVAFDIARDLGVSPREVGTTADLSEISLSKCQLGLFGYQPHKKIVTTGSTPHQDQIDAINASLVEGRLPCEAAWKIAARLKIAKLTLGNICESQGIKITACQLGAF